ncbi:NAD(P)H-dependent glycerol-3-phosphate dehydrogenase [Nitrosomonas oligotropha]|uniref:NAD(P)H-dependent glycerol-3-phosphate dehydrogenase n=1 Tax=Nitrosomonas oligotropha TaxID=42354 RepID=UPI000D4DC109|nr:NAD(P)H-dependent glycerol-3-phosphate dehydrogenase [Nitrosomonas oligotropha]MXS83560.1 NAD(P)-dependent glycerol-3-phosphate dehydrogenase [Nitrosomonas oligotropha]
MKIAVLGAGAWGSALAISLSARHQIHLWTKDPDHATEMDRQRINQAFLPGHLLPESLKITATLEEALKDANLALIVVPVAGLRDTLRGIVASKIKVPVIWGCKGFESETTYLPHQIATEEFSGLLPPCGVLSGPSFAEEVAQGLPTALTLASKDIDFASKMAAELHSARLRIYTSDDIVGVETGGAVKNVITIAAGISDGIGFGHNARAALITRGLSETMRLGLGLGGSMKTFMGLAGVGDLILTSTGDLSRNRQVGLMLAEGKSLADILSALGHVAEGVHTAKSVLQLGNQLKIEMPITQAVCDILHGVVSAKKAVEVLLNREQKSEIY